MCTGREVELSLTEAERVVIVRDLSLAISSALTVETEMITTFTDSERHRQDPKHRCSPDSRVATRRTGEPQNETRNPSTAWQTRTGTEKYTEGRRQTGVSNPKVKESSRSHGKEPADSAAYAAKY